MADPIALGPGRSATAVRYTDAAGDLAGTLAGYRVTHPCTWAVAVEEGSWIPVGPGEWTVVSADPLHLEPSILCTVCGDHGFIRDGRWVPA